MSAWLPIESCPKDLSEFLAFDVRTRTFDVCYWSNIHRVVHAAQRDGQLGPDESQFGYNSDDIQFWMRLPEPPQ